MGHMTIEVIIVDDHPTIRMGISLLMEITPDVNLIGETDNGTKAIELVSTLRPDILLLDFRLPDMSGLQVTKEIQKLGLETKVLGFSAYSDEEDIIELLDAGAKGYILKTESPDMLISAIRAVASGETWLSPTIANKVLARARRNMSSNDILTHREFEVLKLLSRGYSNLEIAKSLVISSATVKNHLNNIYHNLGVCSRAEAIAWAWSNGLVAK
jgi:NarL family two-component system response regulator LiaR